MWMRDSTFYSFPDDVYCVFWPCTLHLMVVVIRYYVLPHTAPVLHMKGMALLPDGGGRWLWHLLLPVPCCCYWWTFDCCHLFFPHCYSHCCPLLLPAIWCCCAVIPPDGIIYSCQPQHSPAHCILFSTITTPFAPWPHNLTTFPTYHDPSHVPLLRRPFIAVDVMDGVGPRWLMRIHILLLLTIPPTFCVGPFVALLAFVILPTTLAVLTCSPVVMMMVCLLGTTPTTFYIDCLLLLYPIITPLILHTHTLFASFARGCPCLRWRQPYSALLLLPFVLVFPIEVNYRIDIYDPATTPLKGIDALFTLPYYLPLPYPMHCCVTWWPYALYCLWTLCALLKYSVFRRRWYCCVWGSLTIYRGGRIELHLGRNTGGGVVLTFAGGGSFVFCTHYWYTFHYQPVLYLMMLVHWPPLLFCWYIVHLNDDVCLYAYPTSPARALCLPIAIITPPLLTILPTVPLLLMTLLLVWWVFVTTTCLPLYSILMFSTIYTLLNSIITYYLSLLSSAAHSPYPVALHTRVAARPSDVAPPVATPHFPPAPGGSDYPTFVLPPYWRTRCLILTLYYLLFTLPYCGAFHYWLTVVYYWWWCGVLTFDDCSFCFPTRLVAWCTLPAVNTSIDNERDSVLMMRYSPCIRTDDVNSLLRFTRLPRLLLRCFRAHYRLPPRCWRCCALMRATLRWWLFVDLLPVIVPYIHTLVDWFV